MPRWSYVAVGGIGVRSTSIARYWRPSSCHCTTTRWMPSERSITTSSRSCCARSDATLWSSCAGPGDAVGVHCAVSRRGYSFPAIAPRVLRLALTRTPRVERIRPGPCTSSSSRGPRSVAPTHVDARARLQESRHDRDRDAIPAVASATRYVYDFAEGSRDMRVLLGGKGANIAEMTRVLGAGAGARRVHDHDRGLRRLHARRPRRARRAGRAGRRGHRTPRGARRAPPRRPRRSAAGLRALRRARLDARDARDDPRPRAQRRVGARAGRPHRRRALRLGLLPALRADVRQRRARRARRALRGDPARRAPPRRRARGPRARRSRSCSDVTHRFRTLYEAHTGEPFPQDPQEQLRLAIRAVFDSWLGDRAVAYRRINHIPDDWGTAVNVQQMVFGNRGAGSRDRRRLLARRDDRRARAERRLPARRAGRGRRLRRPHAAPAARARRRAARTRYAQLLRDPAHARGALRRHAGHRVHRRARAALHAPDAQRQAPGTGRRALRRRRRRRGSAHAASRRCARSTPARWTRCCTRRSTPRPASRCWRAAWPRRRARPRARSSSPPRRRSPPRPRAAT